MVSLPSVHSTAHASVVLAHEAKMASLRCSIDSCPQAATSRDDEVSPRVHRPSPSYILHHVPPLRPSHTVQLLSHPLKLSVIVRALFRSCNPQYQHPLSRLGIEGKEKGKLTEATKSPPNCYAGMPRRPGSVIVSEDPSHHSHPLFQTFSPLVRTPSLPSSYPLFHIPLQRA